MPEHLRSDNDDMPCHMRAKERADIIDFLTNEIAILREALEPFANKTGMRSHTVVLMKKEVINARKALGWVNPLAHGGKDDTKNSSCS